MGVMPTPPDTRRNTHLVLVVILPVNHSHAEGPLAQQVDLRAGSFDSFLLFDILQQPRRPITQHADVDGRGVIVGTRRNRERVELEGIHVINAQEAVLACFVREGAGKLKTDNVSWQHISSRGNSSGEDAVTQHQVGDPDQQAVEDQSSAVHETSRAADDQQRKMDVIENLKGIRLR